MKKLLLTVFRGILAIGMDAQINAAVVTWDAGGSDDLWNIADNWDTNALPGSGDDAIILAGQTVDGDVNNSADLNSLTIGGLFKLNTTSFQSSTTTFLSTSTLEHGSPNSQINFGANTVNFHSGMTVKRDTCGFSGRFDVTRESTFNFVFDAAGYTNNAMWRTVLVPGARSFDSTWTADLSAFTGGGGVLSGQTYDLFSFDLPEADGKDTNFSSMDFTANPDIASWSFVVGDTEGFVRVTVIPEPSVWFFWDLLS